MKVTRRKFSFRPRFPYSAGEALLTAVVVVAMVVVFSGHEHPKKREAAYDIAVKSLNRNIASIKDPESGRVREYLLAGGLQYYTLWTRDFSMAVPGALAIGEHGVVRDSLEAIFGFQKEDGLFPRQVDSLDGNIRWGLSLFRYRPKFRAPLKGWFATENGIVSLDQNLSVPWAASQYVHESKDLEFARRYFDAAALAVTYVENGHREKDGLIGRQPPYADWEDSIKRTGKVAMTNILYVLALRGLSDWAREIGRKPESARFAKRAEGAHAAFLKFFWDEERGVISNFEGDTRLTADANLMAVIHGLVTPARAQQIMRTLRAGPLWTPMPGRPTWPDYPLSLKSETVRLVHTEDYHDSMYWGWLTAAAAMAEQSVGNCRGYWRIMNQLSEQIVSDQAVYEVLELDPRRGKLKPVRRFTYKSEKPFSWGAAYYLKAASLDCSG